MQGESDKGGGGERGKKRYNPYGHMQIKEAGGEKLYTFEI